MFWDTRSQGFLSLVGLTSNMSSEKLIVPVWKRTCMSSLYAYKSLSGYYKLSAVTAILHSILDFLRSTDMKSTLHLPKCPSYISSELDLSHHLKLEHSVSTSQWLLYLPISYCAGVYLRIGASTLEERSFPLPLLFRQTMDIYCHRAHNGSCVSVNSFKNTIFRKM